MGDLRTGTDVARRRPDDADGMRYASIHTSTADLTGASTTYLLERFGLGQRVQIALWDTPPAAVDPKDLYEVEAEWTGLAADTRPGAASLLHFDGPRSPALVEAARRAGRDRIQPFAATLPELCRGYSLWQPDTGGSVVVSFAVTLPGLEAMGVAINSMELLPDEDPALLPGPDRFEVFRVLSGSESAA